MSVTNDLTVKKQLWQAWEDSRPDSSDAHEEGGFILRKADGSILIERWPKGKQDRIIVPLHDKGYRINLPIIATFHTHPNSGPQYDQEPSLTDIRAIENNPDLNHTDYEGEFVISKAVLYIIRIDGSVEELGDSRSLLAIAEDTIGERG